jgi:acid phosphatase family membrane protein YuiD
MEWLSVYLVAIVVAWAIASLVKVVIYFIKKKKISKEPVLTTGGMPSAHTAIVVALTTIIAFMDGINSVAFAISLVFSVIVMTDAVHVRRAVGEQGVAIKGLLSKNIKKPYFERGHKPSEMLVGALLGIVVGIATYLI